MLHLALLLALAPATQPAALDAPATRPAVESYGEPMTLDADAAVPVAVVLADPMAYEGERVRVRGVITEVCKTSGCWMRVGESAEAEQAMFVMFTCDAEGNRLIPLEAAGQVGEVEGMVSVETTSVEDARHFAEDAGATDAEIAAITEPRTEVRLAGPSARVRF